jgi:hypothetical protein
MSDGDGATVGVYLLRIQAELSGGGDSDTAANASLISTRSSAEGSMPSLAQAALIAFAG